MRLVQVTDVVTASSGGLRTTPTHLAEGCAVRGDELVQVLPGPQDEVPPSPWGNQVVLGAPLVPGIDDEVVLDPRGIHRRAADRRREGFDWPATTDGSLQVHCAGSTRVAS